MERQKKVIVMGRVLPKTSNKEHQNQELLNRKGIAMTVKATYYKSMPMVLRKWHGTGKR